ncbi:stemmadenine O-acetyltransferase-like [Silene latifolia]|uniref:stemmadenine O-acetyltransferase-like n=1 Tax=Silene latifolia TaxID=37657 RepID=UPI003D776690
MKLEMKIISKEIIKPSSPTPSNLKALKLSIFDQMFPPYHFPMLLFYNAPTDATPLQITNLKSSLSHTLVQFYPLAGRCIDDGTVSCNDEGIPFIETQVNSSLTEFLALSNKLDYLTQLLPPQESLCPEAGLISDMVPLAIQINVFICGGVVIGCFMFHKLLDTSSLGTFFQYWAAKTTQRNHDAVYPIFDPIVKAFPPCPSTDLIKPVDLPAKSCPFVVLVKSFRFTKTAINDLKVMAGTEVHPNPTSFETVMGFVWESVVAAGCSALMAEYESVMKTTSLLVAINMRPRANPPLPRNSMGNCVIEEVGNSKTQGTFPELVGEIHSTICKAKSTIEAFQGVNAVEEIREDRMAKIQILLEGNPSTYHVSSLSNLGLNEADFGFGKPNWIIPTDGKMSMMDRNYIFLTDYYDLNGEGIEVWLFLEEKEMQVLETNPRFLKFASPY